ncbi:hypothetical protein [Saccharibacillus deserti]|uniref:hypothetical protein n=1 Tax=Saccharibacillus deserti TaxID=1634444 RepID=UPI0015532FD1|nr:hypothetical protein [Saccharibacillus deserti]
MGFCVHCGVELKDYEPHRCTPQAAEVVTASPVPSVQQPFQTEPRPYTREPLPKLEKGKLVSLLKNPMRALELNGESDLSYGLTGIGLFLAGILFWTFSLKRNVIDWLLYRYSLNRSDLFNTTFLGEGLSTIRQTLDENLPILKPMLLISIGSLLALVIFMIALGSWMGTRKANWKNSVAQIGAAQLSSGIMLIAAGLVLFVSLKIGLILFGVLLLVALYITIHVSLQLFQVPAAKVLLFVTAAVLLQITALIFISGYYIDGVLEDLRLGSLSTLFSEFESLLP